MFLCHTDLLTYYTYYTHYFKYILTYLWDLYHHMFGGRRKRRYPIDPHVVATTERVCVRSGFPVCTCLSALAFCTCLSALSLCTSLFALHLVLTPHSTFLVYFLRTSLRRMSFEMIGFGDPVTSADFKSQGFRPSFFVSFFALILE